MIDGLGKLPKTGVASSGAVLPSTVSKRPPQGVKPIPVAARSGFVRVRLNDYQQQKAGQHIYVL